MSWTGGINRMVRVTREAGWDIPENVLNSVWARHMQAMGDYSYFREMPPDDFDLAEILRPWVEFYMDVKEEIQNERT